MSNPQNRDHFERADLLAVSENFGVKGAAEIVDQVTEAVVAWRSIARECGVGSALLKAKPRCRKGV